MLLGCGLPYGLREIWGEQVMAPPWKEWWGSKVIHYKWHIANIFSQWPYTYDSCDVGTAPNQTLNGLPLAAVVDGDHAYGGALSYLPGQRLSRCTCDGEDHPGPKHTDGTYVGRSAPEIDVFEAQMGGTPLIGQVSQSAQWAVSSIQVSSTDTNSSFFFFLAFQPRICLGQHL